MVWKFRRIERIILILIILLVNLAIGSTEQQIDKFKSSSNDIFNVDLDNWLNLEPNNVLANYDLDSNKPDHFELPIQSKNIQENSKQNNLIKEEIPLNSQEKAKVYYEKALTALDNNQEIEATTLFKESLEQDPKYHRSRIQLVKLYQKIGWSDENERLLIEGLDLAPEHSDFIKNLGLLYQQKGQMRKSLSVLLSMPENSTHQIDYLALLALAYLNTDQPDLAVNYYQELLKINRENPLWHLGLAISLTANGNYHEAIDNFNKAKTLGRFNPEILDYINNKITTIKAYE